MMCAAEGIDPIHDGEVLYRKIPVSQGWYDPDATQQVSPKAFNPRSDDTAGLSLDRAHSEDHPDFKTVDQAGQGQSSKGYYVAVLRVEDLRANGIEVVAEPVLGNPGHAVIPDLTYGNRRSDQSLEWKVLLAHELTIDVHGPFHQS